MAAEHGYSSLANLVSELIDVLKKFFTHAVQLLQFAQGVVDRSRGDESGNLPAEPVRDGMWCFHGAECRRCSVARLTFVVIPLAETALGVIFVFAIV